MNVDEKTDTAAWPEGKDFMVSTILEWESWRGLVQSRHVTFTYLWKTEEAKVSIHERILLYSMFVKKGIPQTVIPSYVVDRSLCMYSFLLYLIISCNVVRY